MIASLSISEFAAQAEVKIEPPPASGTAVPMPVHATDAVPQTTGRPSIWHFQATYGISMADVENPAWDTKTDPASPVQRSTTGVFTESRYNHSIEAPIHPRQSVRYGLSLVNAQSIAASGWMSSLAGKSKAPDWRTWGLGGDLFLLRQMTPNLDIEAGIQADYFISGVTTLPVAETTTNELQNSARLEQKLGWRVAFSGGIGGLYLGPLGLILRLSGQIIQSQFKGHPQPLRIQGLQIQMGAGLALGRGEP